MTNLLD